MGIISDLLPVIDSILGVRDSIGAVIQTAYIVTRTWTGTNAGEGTSSDVAVAVSPSPQIVDLSHNYRALAGGNYQQGDLLLKNMSKHTYSTYASVDLTGTAANVEKFYRINSKLYQVVHVKESYVTWDVQIRKLAHN